MNRAELVMRRRNVREFINADPVLITVSRKADATRNPDTGGTIAGVTSLLEEQRARIVLNKRRYNNGIVNAEAGQIPHTDYLLLAMPDKDFQVNDTFVWLGVNYKVTGRFESRQESILCSIDLLGKDNKVAE